jgi:hypothetical protein
MVLQSPIMSYTPSGGTLQLGIFEVSRIQPGLQGVRGYGGSDQGLWQGRVRKRNGTYEGLGHYI